MCLTPIFLKLKNRLPISISCGNCPECRLARQNSWYFRLYQESKHYGDASKYSNLFLTLTYDPEHLPSNGSLNKRDAQNFLKRLRINFERQFKNSSKLKYFLVGEYGGDYGRPHYHLVLFGLPSNMNEKVYSLILKSWGFGIVDRKFLSSRYLKYVSKYCVKQSSYKTNKKHYVYVGEDPSRPKGYVWFNPFKKTYLLNNFILASKNLGLTFLTTSRIVEIVFKGTKLFSVNGKKMYLPRYYIDYINRNFNFNRTKKISFVLDDNYSPSLAFQNFVSSLFFPVFKSHLQSQIPADYITFFICNNFPAYSPYESEIFSFFDEFNSRTVNWFETSYSFCVPHKIYSSQYYFDFFNSLLFQLYKYDVAFSSTFKFLFLDDFIKIHFGRYYSSFVHKDSDLKRSYFMFNRYRGNIFKFEQVCRSFVSRYGFFISYCF